MNWELIVSVVAVSATIVIPLGGAIWSTGKRLTEFMAIMEQRVSSLEKAEDTVCNRLEAMEQRQTERHERVLENFRTLREELVSTNSIKPRT
jgi:hypothetical protein